MNYQNFSVVFGFSVWLIATLAFRFWGHLFFLIDNHILVIGFFLGIAPALFFLVKWVFNKYQLTRNEKLRSAVLMALPGMLGDVLCINFHAFVFPTLTVEQAIVLGAWVLWAYSIVLFMGFNGDSNAKMTNSTDYKNI